MARDKEDLKKIVKDFPRSPGVYLMKGRAAKVIYVGKAKDLRARVKSYFGKSKGQSVKTLYLVGQIENIEYILTRTEVEAFLLEASLIKKYRPRYNIRLKDDRAYPYIRLSMADPYPRLYLARRVENDGALYFGPYTSGHAVRGTIRFLNETYRIRDCADGFFKTRKRPCMTHQIGRCTGPCVGLVSEKEYGEDVLGVVEFLKGEDQRVFKSLEKAMKKASREERFEAAAKIRDNMESIRQIWQKQTVMTQDRAKSVDVVAFHGGAQGTLIETLHIRNGRVTGSRPHFIPGLDASSQDENPREWLTSFLNQYYAENIIPDVLISPVDLSEDIYRLLRAVFKERQSRQPMITHSLDMERRKLMDLAEKNAQAHFQDAVKKKDQTLAGLEAIQKKFGLEKLPFRIECFDVSHLQGDATVASQVVFVEGAPKKEDYKRYKIRSVNGVNDFAAMKEVLSRRLRHREWEDPDLIVVDGGRGQLKVALEVLKELGRNDIPVVGLAKARSRGRFTDQEITATEERFYLPGRQNPVVFPSYSDAFRILVSVRDEAHRFALAYHRKLRSRVTAD